MHGVVSGGDLVIEPSARTWWWVREGNCSFVL